MDIIEFEIELERKIRQTINSCYPSSWDEDTITHELLKCLGTYFRNNTQFSDLNRETKIKFSAYKLKGKAETNYGDIAFLASIRFDNGITFKGIASFEAKKRLQNSFDYREESSKNQYKNIVTYNPYAQLLLYDYEPITEHLKPIILIDKWKQFHGVNLSQLLISHCVCLPLYMVQNVKKVNRNYNRISRTLSEQVCRRLFYGIDLQLEQKCIDDITEFDNQKHPKFLVDIQIAHGNTDITEDGINREFLQKSYDRIEQSNN